MAPLRTRIAPTPSGFLHIGNIYSFYLTWHRARSIGARILLRIDDLDAERSRPEYVESIFRTLEFAGITWDDGPSGPDDHYRSWSQSSRRDRYESALSSLRGRGVLFACDCSRANRTSFSGVYPGTCRDRGLSFDGNAAVRMRIDADTVIVNDHFRGPVISSFPANMRDVIVRRRDGIAAYQLASVVDDMAFGITHVVRGSDLFDSTCVQTVIADALGYGPFKRISFLHHRLITAEGKKLSKTQRAEPVLSAYRDRSALLRDLHAMALSDGYTFVDA